MVSLVECNCTLHRALGHIHQKGKQMHTVVVERRKLRRRSRRPASCVTMTLGDYQAMQEGIDRQRDHALDTMEIGLKISALLCEVTRLRAASDMSLAPRVVELALHRIQDPVHGRDLPLLRRTAECPCNGCRYEQ